MKNLFYNSPSAQNNADEVRLQPPACRAGGNGAISRLGHEKNPPCLGRVLQEGLQATQGPEGECVGVECGH